MKMRALYLIFTAIILGMTGSHAQGVLNLENNVRFGLAISGHNSHIRGIHNQSLGRYAPAFGIYTQINLIPNKTMQGISTAKIYFVAQVEYSMEGEKTKFKTGEVNKYIYDYINIPMYIKYNFAFSRGTKPNFMIMGGPVTSFSVYQNYVGDKSLEREVVQIAHSNFKKFSFGASVGIGYRFIPQLEGYFRYDHGFTKVYGNYDKHNTYKYFLAAGLNWFFN